MPCRSTVTSTSQGGRLQHVEFCCEGQCPDGAHCCVQIAFDLHGGSRTWCGCGPQEPKECHIVLVTPGPGSGGGKPAFVCAGECPKGQQCVHKEETIKPGVVRHSCECSAHPGTPGTTPPPATVPGDPAPVTEGSQTKKPKR